MSDANHASNANHGIALPEYETLLGLRWRDVLGSVKVYRRLSDTPMEGWTVRDAEYNGGRRIKVSGHGWSIEVGVALDERANLVFGKPVIRDARQAVTENASFFGPALQVETLDTLSVLQIEDGGRIIVDAK